MADNKKQRPDAFTPEELRILRDRLAQMIKETKQLILKTDAILRESKKGSAREKSPKKGKKRDPSE